MERLKRSSWFWVALLVTMVLPTSVLANKRLYHTNLQNAGGSGVGASTIFVNRVGSYEFRARTTSLGGGQVTQVWLAPANNAWQIPLCQNSGPAEDNCTYSDDGSGNLDVEGVINGSMLMAAGVTGSQFSAALSGGTLQVFVSNGASILGSGTYIRIL
jgi:hypothetical protein